MGTDAWDRPLWRVTWCQLLQGTHLGLKVPLGSFTWGHHRCGRHFTAAAQLCSWGRGPAWLCRRKELGAGPARGVEGRERGAEPGLQGSGARGCPGLLLLLTPARGSWPPSLAPGPSGCPGPTQADWQGHTPSLSSMGCAQHPGTVVLTPGASKHPLHLPPPPDSQGGSEPSSSTAVTAPRGGSSVGGEKRPHRSGACLQPHGSGLPSVVDPQPWHWHGAGQEGRPRISHLGGLSSPQSLCLVAPSPPGGLLHPAAHRGRAAPSSNYRCIYTRKALHIGDSGCEASLESTSSCRPAASTAPQADLPPPAREPGSPGCCSLASQCDRPSAPIHCSPALLRVLGPGGPSLFALRPHIPLPRPPAPEMRGREASGGQEGEHHMKE